MLFSTVAELESNVVIGGVVGCVLPCRFRVGCSIAIDRGGIDAKGGH